MKTLAAVLQSATEAEALAVYHALEQFVQNNEDVLPEIEERATAELSANDRAILADTEAARSLMEKMDAVFIELAGA